MKNYLGVKVIDATPMNRQEYNLYRGWQLPADENGNDEGYFVEYLDGGSSNHPNHKGYISWSPKQVFDNLYRPTDGLTFGLAIEALKQGNRVARKGWNGKGMYVLLQIPDENSKMNRPYIYMECPNGSTKQFGVTINEFDRVPWLASQTDILSEDWVIL